MKETDKEFVERMQKLFPMRGLDRLFDLARRGADAAAEIDRLKAEVSALNHAEVKLLVQVDEQDAEIERLRAALRYALENGTTSVYGSDDDECGTYSCCGEVSYKPHENDCWTVKARAALKEDGDA